MNTSSLLSITSLFGVVLSSTGVAELGVTYLANDSGALDYQELGNVSNSL
jgi:hypothetical protein